MNLLKQRLSSYDPDRVPDGHVRLMGMIGMGDPDYLSTTTILGTSWWLGTPDYIFRPRLQDTGQIVVYDVPQHLVPDDPDDIEETPIEPLHAVALMGHFDWDSCPFVFNFSTHQGLTGVQLKSGRSREEYLASINDEIPAIIVELKRNQVVRGATKKEVKKALQLALCMRGLS